MSSMHTNYRRELKVGRIKPHRDPAYLAFVDSLGCCICGQDSTHHHLTGHGYGGRGTKASDYLTMPLCNNHHTGEQGIHRMGVDSWETIYGSQFEFIAITQCQARSVRA